MALRAKAHDADVLRRFYMKTGEAKFKPPKGKRAAEFAAGIPNLPDPITFTDEQRRRVGRAAAWGIMPAETAMRVAIWAGMPFYLLCAYLKQETGDGTMKIGSDRTWMRGVILDNVGITLVDEQLFLIYRCQRADLGMQGMGSMQLTHFTIQDRADQLGGCWDIVANIATGAEWIAILLDQGLTLDEVAKRYNGGDAYVLHNQEIRADAKAAINKGATT